MLLFAELEEKRAKMESYKHLYDAGGSLPGGSNYKLRPYYLKGNPVYEAKALPWMLKNKVPGTLQFLSVSTFL